LRKKSGIPKNEYLFVFLFIFLNLMVK